MNILAFDCCFGAASAAVRHADGRLRSARYQELAGSSVERLFPLIGEVLAEAALRTDEVDCIAVTLGPGTFTGVRVGIAAARAFSLGLRKPVVGTTSLAVMAHRARQRLKLEDPRQPLAVAVDARKGMIYLQRFESASSDSGDPALVTIADVARMLASPKPREPLLAVGSGAAALADEMRAAGCDCRADLLDLQPHADSLAELAVNLEPLELVEPVYLRQPDVKVRETVPMVGGRT